MNERVIAGLSDRLAKIAVWVPRGARVLDVGTDHALLPIYLIRQEKADFVIASDVAIGPYETAKSHVLEAGLAGRIDVRLASGLKAVNQGEVDTVVMAGMGGATMADILDEGAVILTSLETLILQPMNGWSKLRKNLINYGFEISDERMIEEGGRTYQLILARRSTSAAANKVYEPYIREGCGWLALEFGPMNLARHNDDVVLGVVQSAAVHWRTVVQSLSGDAGGATTDRKRELMGQLHEMESWINRTGRGS